MPKHLTREQLDAAAVEGTVGGKRYRVIPAQTTKSPDGYVVQRRSRYDSYWVTINHPSERAEIFNALMEE